MGLDGQQKPRPSFVDSFWEHLDAAVRIEAERRLAEFVRRQNTSKWIIAADFCIRDQTRPNDSFAFVILPAGDKFRQTQALLGELPSSDLKDARRIHPALKRALTDGRAFTFCFVADRERRLYVDAEAARRSLDESIAMMEQWENAYECGEIIGKVRAMRAEAAKSNLNLRLIEDLTITAAFAAYLVALLCRLGSVELVGWAPDRGKIAECYSGIASTLFEINVASYCGRHGLKKPQLGLFTQTSEDPWCDPMIRLADYVAGVAAWDPPVDEKVHPKIAELISHVFADNRRLFVFRIAFRAFDGQGRIEIAQVRISKAVPTGRPRERRRVVPLRGRSLQLKDGGG